MWLFTKHGFYSITKIPDHYSRKVHTHTHQVRARSYTDLQNLTESVSFLAGREITTDFQADYHYRFHVSEKEMLNLLDLFGKEIDYSNFKNTVAGIPNQHDKCDYYGRVWGVMYGYQREKERPLWIEQEEAIYGRQLSIYEDREREHGIGLDEPTDHIPLFDDTPNGREVPYSPEVYKELYGE